jgi:hypothetical protein
VSEAILNIAPPLRRDKSTVGKDRRRRSDASAPPKRVGRLDKARDALTGGSLAVENDVPSLINVICQATADPATDGDKLDRLFSIYERVTAQRARVAYATSLAAMQSELPVIAERGTIRGPGGETTYALWEDINEEIRPILKKHGFALSFRTGRDGDLVVVTGVLSHHAGHAEETTMYLPADLSGDKNPLQAIGSSTSYGKRYTAAALLNITSCGEHDDGWAVVRRSSRAHSTSR